MNDRDEIMINLFLGNSNSAQDTTKRYSLIVNCTADIPRTEPPNSEYFINIPIDDFKTPEMNDIFYNSLKTTTEKMFSVLNQGGTVLVHCRVGVSRSASVIAAFLTRYTDITLIQSIVYTKWKRPIAFSNCVVNFEKALLRLHLKLNYN